MAGIDFDNFFGKVKLGGATDQAPAPEPSAAPAPAAAESIDLAGSSPLGLNSAGQPTVTREQQAARDKDRAEILGRELASAQERLKTGDPRAQGDIEALQREIASAGGAKATGTGTRRAADAPAGAPAAAPAKAFNFDDYLGPVPGPKPPPAPEPQGLFSRVAAALAGPGGTMPPSEQRRSKFVGRGSAPSKPPPSTANQSVLDRVRPPEIDAAARDAQTDQLLRDEVAPWKRAETARLGDYVSGARAPSAKPLTVAENLAADVRDATKNPVARGAVAGFFDLGQVGAGAVRLAADVAGADDVSQFAAGASRVGKAMSEGSMQGLQGNDKLIAQVTNSIMVSAPSMAVGVMGGPALRTLFAQSALAEYNEGRNAGFDPGQSAARAGIMGLAEALGERFGFQQQIKVLKGLVKGMPSNEMAKTVGEMIAKEIPGEQLTTAMQFLADKIGPAAQRPNATLADYLEAAGETLKVTIAQSAVMGGGPALVATTRDAVRGADKSIERGALSVPERAAADAGFGAAGMDPKQAAASAIESSPYGKAAAVQGGVLGGPAGLATRTRGVARDSIISAVDEAAARYGLAPKAAAALREAVVKMTPEEALPFIERALTGMEKRNLVRKAGIGTAFRDALQQQLDAPQVDNPVDKPAAEPAPAAAAAAAAAPAPAAPAAPTAPAAEEDDGTGLADSTPRITTPVDEAAHQAAHSPTNDRPEPTDAQKEAGNYQKGHVRIGGLDIAVENPQGSKRSGTAPDGTPWETTLTAHYGYVKGTLAGDGDHSDVFVKPGTSSDYAGPVFVIDQVDPKTGRFDEHKAVLGAATEEEARRIYLSNYDKGWQGLGAITQLPIEAYRSWVKDGTKRKPLGKIDERVGDLAGAAGEVAAAGDGGGDQPGRGGRAVGPVPAVPGPVGGTAEAPVASGGPAGAVADGGRADDALTGKAKAQADLDAAMGDLGDLMGKKPGAAPQVLVGKTALFDGFGASVGSLAEGTRRQLMVDPAGGYFWGHWRQESKRDVGAIAGGEHKGYTPASFATGAEARAAAAATPQDRRSPSAPTAAAPSAPSPAPAPAARTEARGTAKHPKSIMGSRLLAKVSEKLGGLDPAWLSEFSHRQETARKGKDGRPVVAWRNPMVAGVGTLFRRGGTQDLQQLAELMEAEGYLPPGSVERDTKAAGEQAKELVRSALNREEPKTTDQQEAEHQAAADAEREAYYAELDAEAAREAEAERQAIMAANDIEPAELGAMDDDDIAFDAPAVFNQDAHIAGMRAMGFTDQEIADDLAQRQGTPAAVGPGQTRQDGPKATPPPDAAGGAAPGNRAEAEQEAADQGLTLSSQTPDELRAKTEREQSALDGERRTRAAEQERLRREQEQRDTRARADATVDDFQLGQSAEQQLSGMDDLFAPPREPSPPQPEPEPPNPAALPDSAPRELSDAEALAKPERFAGRPLEQQVLVGDTGQVAKLKMDAHQALQAHRERLDALKRLRECLGAAA